MACKACREMSEQRESCVLAMPLSDSHLAVPKTFQSLYFLALSNSHLLSLSQITSNQISFQSKLSNYFESLKLFLGHFSICAVSFLGFTSRFVPSAQVQNHECKAKPRTFYAQNAHILSQIYWQGHMFQALVAKVINCPCFG